jgi:phage terminase large subunit-like protein
VAQLFSAEDPQSLRGPQFSHAWCDELAKWKRGEEAYDMLHCGLRLGARPRQMITTTPRPVALIRRLLADPATAVTHARTQANAFNLAPAFLDNVMVRYGGTRLGRQEIDGEIIEDRDDALWTRAMIEAARVAQAPPLSRIVVGIDPPASSREGADACGLVAAGRAEDGCIYVLEDATAAGLPPAAWAARALMLYRRHRADCLVAEVNQGGEMVRAVLHQVDPAAPVKCVHAKHGKWVRAEPAAAMYARGRIKHVDPPLAQLEDEMCDFGLDGLSSGRSPDRLDALVWAIAALAFGANDGPRVRVL